MNKLSKSITIILLILGFASLAGNIFASSSDGTISDIYKYAWADRTGWLNFAATGGNIHVTDAELTGYIWSDNYGWIILNPSTSGVKNNGLGTLSGSAWGENTGWINFSGVTIDGAGIFKGTASGDIVGTLNFDCSNCRVQTDWISSAARNKGGAIPGGSGTVTLPAPIRPYSILINNGQEYTNNQRVDLEFSAGSDVKRMEISNTPGFENVSPEDYQTAKAWNLCGASEEICTNLIFPATGLSFTVYAKFYTAQGIPSDIVSANIIFDNQPPTINITSIKEFYSPDEDIILAGNSEPNSIITLYWANKYGLGHTDAQGNWLINLGKLPIGTYPLELTPKDVAGNIGKPVTTNLVVRADSPPFTPPAPSTPPTSPTSPITEIIDWVKIVLKPLIPEIFFPKAPTPEVIVTVPENAPMALRGGWDIISQTNVNGFACQPLSREIMALTYKFSSLAKTFKEVGVTKASDIGKIQNTTLILPGLSEITNLSGTAVKPGEFALPKGVPLAKLTNQAKAKIPTEIVFARTAGELVDFNISLSLTEKGNPQQLITTLVNKPLDLVVKPDKPVKSIKGYIIFKSKIARPVSLNLPLKSLTASLIFAEPNLAQPQTEPVSTTDELVLLEFEYTDPDGDGVYTATIQSPTVDGEYEIVTVMDYQDPNLGMRAIRMITIVDPEGYVYEKNGDNETRINGAIVSLYWLNPEIKQYELWPAKEYNQENSQVTDVSGSYSFLVPEGSYYIKIDAPGYQTYEGKVFEVKEGSGIHSNIELKTKYWWVVYFDWKNIVIAFAIIILLYNFYRYFIMNKIQNINKIENKN